MTMANLPRPVAFVFTAGLARSAAQVGMLDRLLAAGVTPDIVVGTSLGAINAAATAASPADAVARLETVWRALGSEHALSSLTMAIVRGIAQGQANRAARHLREILADTVPVTPMNELPFRLTVVASELATGHIRTLEQGPAIDAVMASCALPAIFPPVERDGEFLIDGALVAGVPSDQALQQSPGSIVVLDTGDPSVGEAAAAKLRWWGVAAVSYGYLVRGQMSHALARAAAQVPVVVVSTDAGPMLDFEKAEEAIAAGAAAADIAMAHLPREPAVGLHGMPIGFDGLPALERLLVTDW